MALGLSCTLSMHVAQVERMGDSKQQVREESKNVLLTLFEVGHCAVTNRTACSLDSSRNDQLKTVFQAMPVGGLLGKLSWVWGNKNFRIKEELASTLAIVFQNIGVGALSAEDEQHLIGHTVHLLEDNKP